MHLSPGNSKVNAPLPWKFQGSSTGGVQIIIGIAPWHRLGVFDFHQHKFINFGFFFSFF
jgi:hypothetical protein